MPCVHAFLIFDATITWFWLYLSMMMFDTNIIIALLTCYVGLVFPLIKAFTCIELLINVIHMELYNYRVMSTYVFMFMFHVSTITIDV